MNFDIGNKALLVDGWRDMSSAPRDGSVIEIMNIYGVAPSFRLATWTNEIPGLSASGPITVRANKSVWVHVGKMTYNDSEEFLRWRSYDGNPSAYVDPTGGAQDSDAYWRGAVAQKYGLPVAALENETRRNSAQNWLRGLGNRLRQLFSAK